MYVPSPLAVSAPLHLQPLRPTHTHCSWPARAVVAYSSCWLSASPYFDFPSAIVPQNRLLRRRRRLLLLLLLPGLFQLDSRFPRCLPRWQLHSNRDQRSRRSTCRRRPLPVRWYVSGGSATAVPVPVPMPRPVHTGLLFRPPVSCVWWHSTVEWCACSLPFRRQSPVPLRPHSPAETAMVRATTRVETQPRSQGHRCLHHASASCDTHVLSSAHRAGVLAVEARHMSVAHPVCSSPAIWAAPFVSGSRSLRLRVQIEPLLPLPLHLLLLILLLLATFHQIPLPEWFHSRCLCLPIIPQRALHNAPTG
mmetsp:Transcript_10925/g.33482  ORF Transcript_10925/g.33482 Transcript_10925/m.33482 type:complete len:307 (+) Transcript_10925:892-1812(+)